jgi:Flp pilus assembly protein TadD
MLWHALELSPQDDEYLRAVGWAVFNSGDETQGRVLLQEAHQANRSNMVTLTDLALVYTRAFQFHDALHCARRALELDPQSSLAQDVLRVVQRFKLEYERLTRQGKIKGQVIEA